MNIKISVPKAEDIPTMVAWGKGSRELWASESGGWYSPETLMDIIRNPGTDILLVAKDGDKPVGMTLVQGMREWAYCAAVFVAKEYRGKGIGKQLIEEDIKRLKKLGIHHIALLVDLDYEETPGFYRKLGFKNGLKFLWMDKKF